MMQGVGAIREGRPHAGFSDACRSPILHDMNPTVIAQTDDLSGQGPNRPVAGVRGAVLDFNWMPRRACLPDTKAMTMLKRLNLRGAQVLVRKTLEARPLG